MAFMKKQIVFDTWYEVETQDCGTCFVPSDVIGDIEGVTEDEINDDSPFWEDACDQIKDYVEGSRLLTIRLVEGYGARLSAPGYMDCTEWSVFDTEKEAEDYLEEYYPDDEENEDEE